MILSYIAGNDHGGIMTKERIGLGLCAVLAAGLLAWNLKLQADIRGLQVESTAPVVASTAAAHAGHDAPEAERSPENRRRPARRSERSEPTRDDAERSGNEVVVVGEDEGEGREGRGERRRRGRMDWDQVRSEMETNTVDIVESFAATNEWEPKVTDDIITILLDSGDEVGQLWAAAHEEEGEEERSRYQIHQEMEEIRDGAAEKITDLVGSDAYDAIAEELYEARRETFRRTHEG